MARTGTEASSVRKGLADRMKPKPKQATSAGGGGTNYSARFQNPGAGSNRARTADRSRFQNPGAGRPAPSTAPSPRSSVGATRPVGQTTIHGGFKGATATAGAVPQTPGRPGGRFGTWTPRQPQVARAAPMQPVPARQPMQAAQAAPQQVPGYAQTPGRPMAPQMAAPMPMPRPMPQMAQAAPMPQPMPQMAQAYYPQPQPMQVAQPYYPQPMPQPAQPVYPQPQYNPTPYNPNQWR